MSIRRRSFLTALAAAALTAAGCGGNEVIPLADVPPPPEGSFNKPKDAKLPGAANTRSPQVLKYGN